MLTRVTELRAKHVHRLVYHKLLRPPLISFKTYLLAVLVIEVLTAARGTVSDSKVLLHLTYRRC